MKAAGFIWRHINPTDCPITKLSILTTSTLSSAEAKVEMTGFEDLIGKPAPSFTLPNYDGQPFEYKPGGLPTALLFYPQSG